MALFERNAALDLSLAVNRQYTGIASNSTRVFVIDDTSNVVLVYDHNLILRLSENFSVLEESYAGLVATDTHVFLLKRSNPTELVAYGVTPQILDGANIPLANTSGYQGMVDGDRYVAAIRSPTGGQPVAQFYDMQTRGRIASLDMDLPSGEAHRSGLMDLWSLWYINEPIGTDRHLRSVRRSNNAREMDLDFDLSTGTYTGATILKNKGRALILSNGTGDKAIRNYTYFQRRWALGSRPPVRANLTRSLITDKLYLGSDLIYLKPPEIMPPDAPTIPDQHNVYERLAAITGAEALQFTFARSGNDTTRDFGPHIEHQTGGLTTHRYNSIRLIVNVEQLVIDSTAFGNWQSTINGYTDAHSVVLYSITNNTWIMWRANATTVLNTDEVAWDSNAGNFIQIDASSSSVEFSDVITEGDNQLVLGVIPNDTFRVDLTALPDPVYTRLDALSDFIDFFDARTGTSNNMWRFDTGGSTGSSQTGPSANNPYPFVYFETSSSNRNGIQSASLATAKDSALAGWTGEGRSVAFRACIQGVWTGAEDAEGLVFEGQLPGGAWEEFHHVPGWAYEATRNIDDVVTDTAGNDLTVVAAGGWVDFRVDVPTQYTGFRMFVRYTSALSTFRHDAALWQWSFVPGV